MEYTSLLILILIVGQISGLPHTVDFLENAEYADRYREYGGRLHRFPPWQRTLNPMVIPIPATRKVTAKIPNTTTKPIATKTPVTRNHHTTTKTPPTTTSTPHMTRLITKRTTPNTPTLLPPRPRWQNQTPSTTTMTPYMTSLTTKLTTPNTRIPLSLDITGARLKHVRQTKDQRVFKHTFHENEELRLTCTFQTQRTPHVLKLMNEFGQGSQMNSDHDNINIASISYNFTIDSYSKYIYCIAMDTAGRTLLTTVDLEYVGPTSDSDCRSGEHLQPGKLVVIKDDLPPLLWTIGLVIQVFPAVDNSSISVARVLTGTGGGVPIIKPFTDLCLLNN